MTSDLMVEGVATALSSIAHGGEHAGTVQFLRREKFVQPDGSVVEVPVVSGNAVRGLLRDHSARALWDMLGRPRLPTAVFHLLWSGGALAKAGSAGVLSSEQLARVYDLVPHVAVFGGAGGGRILEGRLQVGKMVPVCAETVHVMPSGVEVSQVRSIWEMLQVEEFTRRDDAARPTLSAALPDRTGSPDGELFGDVGDGEADAPQQMRYGVETLPAGCRLHWWMALRSPSDLEVECAAEALRRWVAAGSHVGGRSATGHGRVLLSADGWTSSRPALTDGGPLPETARLADHVAAHAEDIVEALSWLT